MDIDDIDIKSDESDNMLNRSIGSFSSSLLEECGNRVMDGLDFTVSEYLLSFLNFNVF